MKIDFVGFPGSGKTSVADTVAFSLFEKGKSVKTRTQQRFHDPSYNSFLINKPLLWSNRLINKLRYYSNSILYLMLLNSAKKQADNQKMLTMINIKRCVKAHSIRDHNEKLYDYLIFDTSPTHLLLPYFFSGGHLYNTESISKVTNNKLVKLKIPDILVFIHTDFDLIVNRLARRNRKNGKYENIDEVSLEYLFLEYQEAVHKVMSVYSDKYKVKNLIVDGKKPVNRIADEIIEKLLM